MNGPSTERRALDTLLARYPGFDLLAVDWQEPSDWTTGLSPGVWMIVELGQRSDDGSETWARHSFAIFKRTGAVHGLHVDGSVTDEALPI